MRGEASHVRRRAVVWPAGPDRLVAGPGQVRAKDLGRQDTRGQPGFRKITGNVAPDFAAFGWTGHTHWRGQRRTQSGQ
jgi:hypothetical protein